MEGTAALVALTALVALAGLAGCTREVAGQGANPNAGTATPPGGRVLVTLTAHTVDGRPPSQQSLDQARDIVRRRLAGLGAQPAQVVVAGTSIVITASTGQVDAVKAAGTTGQLRLHPVVQAYPLPAGTYPAGTYLGATPEQSRLLTALDCAKAQPTASAAGEMIATCDPGRTVKYLLDPSILDGTSIRDDEPTSDQQYASGWQILLSFTGQGQAVWAQYTAAHIGKQVAFVLDDRVISVPLIQAAITGSTQISGTFTEQSARDLANILKYGALPLLLVAASVVTVN